MHGLHHVLARVAGGVDVALTHRAGELRREHDSFAFRCDELAQVFFASAGRVHVRGIDEVAAGFPERVVDTSTFLLVDAEASLSAKRHCAEPELGDAQSTLAEKPIFHVYVTR